MIRQPRTSQPQGPVGIDWGNPLTRGLRLAGIPALGFANMVNGVPFKRVFQGAGTIGGRAVTSASGVPVVYGRYLSNPNGSAVEAAGVTYDGGEFSYLSFRATLLNQEADEAGIGDGTSGNGWKLSFSGNVSTPAITNNATTVAQSNFYATSGARRQGAVIHIFRTGSLDTWAQAGSRVLASTAHAITPSASSQSFVCGGVKNTSGVFGSGNANSALVLYWDRALTEVEARQITQNPWAIFQPVNRAIWVPVAAAGGSPYTLTADTANVSIAGTDTGLAFNRTIIAEAASLAINGTATGLAFNRVLTADTANLALTGNAATLTYTPIGGPTYTLTADTANTAIAGADAGLAFNRRLIADTANLPISGTDAGLARGYTLAADTTALGISGSDAALIAVRKLVADSYALAVAGADAALTYTPLTLPTIGRPASDTSNAGWTASTGSDLFAMIDEVTPSAADYISASSVGAVCQVALNTTAYPGSASQVLKYRASSSTGNSVIVRLKEGVTTIRAETQLLTATDTEYSITLTSGEIAAITSGALSVELESA